jgi:hypothetical protein
MTAPRIFIVVLVGLPAPHDLGEEDLIGFGLAPSEEASGEFHADKNSYCVDEDPRLGSKRRNEITDLVLPQ